MKRIILAVLAVSIAAVSLGQVATTKPAAKKFSYLSDKMNETVEITRAELAAIQASATTNADLHRRVGMNDHMAPYYAPVVTITAEPDCIHVVAAIQPTERDGVTVVEKQRCLIATCSNLAEKLAGFDGKSRKTDLPIVVTIKSGSEVLATRSATGKIVTKFDK